MLSSHIFHSKVIDNESKGNGSCLMPPQAVGVLAWKVSMGCKSGLECVAGNATRLGKSVHAFVNSDVDVAIDNEVCQVIL